MSISEQSGLVCTRKQLLITLGLRKPNHHPLTELTSLTATSRLFNNASNK